MKLQLQVSLLHDLIVSVSPSTMAVWEWDSHIHGSQGALVATSLPSTTPEMKADYLSVKFCSDSFQLEDAQMCSLESSVL